jgi:hypothetical protein
VELPGLPGAVKQESFACRRGSFKFPLDSYLLRKKSDKKKIERMKRNIRKKDL